MPTPHQLAAVVFIGCGATAIMDAWSIFIGRIGGSIPDYALVGRWVGHIPRGRFAHTSIRESAPIAGELALGWSTHYAIGVVFAGLLVGLCGNQWITHPSMTPSLLFGIGTVVAPLLVMQPAMGAGIASTRTPAPLRNCLRSLANHVVFGFGLYLSARAFAAIT